MYKLYKGIIYVLTYQTMTRQFDLIFLYDINIVITFFIKLVFHKAESSSSDEEEEGDRRFIKIKASKTHKGPYDFDMLVPVQYMEGAHHVSISYT